MVSLSSFRPGLVGWDQWMPPLPLPPLPLALRCHSWALWGCHLPQDQTLQGGAPVSQRNVFGGRSWLWSGCCQPVPIWHLALLQPLFPLLPILGEALEALRQPTTFPLPKTKLLRVPACPWWHQAPSRRKHPSSLSLYTSPGGFPLHCVPSIAGSTACRDAPREQTAQASSSDGL